MLNKMTKIKFLTRMCSRKNAVILVISHYCVWVFILLKKYDYAEVDAPNRDSPCTRIIRKRYYFGNKSLLRIGIDTLKRNITVVKVMHQIRIPHAHAPRKNAINLLVSHYCVSGLIYYKEM